MPPLLTKNLVKKFDAVRAVNNLSLDFKAGQITSIIGPNGSGKSTLVNLLTGVLSLDGGEVLIAGSTKLTKLSAPEVAAYGLTRTFQDVRLFEQMTVLDNVLVVLTDRPVFRAFFEKHNNLHLAQVEEVLRKLGLWEKRDELAANLSYGQRKLLEIARVTAMMHSGVGEINIFLFDEPFAGLFPEMIKIVTNILQELKRENKVVVLIEHNMDLIRELSDRVIVLDAGQLLAEGAPESVLAQPEVIEAYLGE